MTGFGGVGAMGSNSYMHQSPYVPGNKSIIIADDNQAVAVDS